MPTCSPPPPPAPRQMRFRQLPGLGPASSGSRRRSPDRAPHPCAPEAPSRSFRVPKLQAAPSLRSRIPALPHPRAHASPGSSGRIPALPRPQPSAPAAASQRSRTLTLLHPRAPAPGAPAAPSHLSRRPNPARPHLSAPAAAPRCLLPAKRSLLPLPRRVGDKL